MQDAGVEFEWRDTAKAPLSKSEVEALIGDRDPEDFLSKRSTPYRELGLADKKLTRKQIVDLLAKEANLLRRPLLVRGKEMIFGFQRDVYEKL